MLRKSLIKQSFNNSASKYDNYAILQKEIANELLAILFKDAKLTLLDNVNILDLGCGTGYLSEIFSKNIKTGCFTQLDLSLNMCKLAKGKTGSITTVNADIEYLPFNKNIFDYVVSSSSFQWLEEIHIGFKEVWRVLKSRGIFAFSIFGENTLNELSQSFSLIDNDKHVNDFLSEDIIEKTMLNIGFTDLKIIKSTKLQHFPNILEIMRYLHNLGAGYKRISTQQAFLTKSKLDKLNNLYKKNFSDKHGLITSWEIYYFLALKL